MTRVLSIASLSVLASLISIVASSATGCAADTTSGRDEEAAVRADDDFVRGDWDDASYTHNEGWTADDQRHAESEATVAVASQRESGAVLAELLMFESKTGRTLLAMFDDGAPEAFRDIARSATSLSDDELDTIHARAVEAGLVPLTQLPNAGIEDTGLGCTAVGTNAINAHIRSNHVGHSDNALIKRAGTLAGKRAGSWRTAGDANTAVARVATARCNDVVAWLRRAGVGGRTSFRGNPRVIGRSCTPRGCVNAQQAEVIFTKASAGAAGGIAWLVTAYPTP